MLQEIKLPKRTKRHADMGNISYMALVGGSGVVNSGWESKFDYISKKVCTKMGVQIEDVLGKARYTELVFARHLIVYLLSLNTHFSLKEIGRRMGYKDHSCCVHAIQSIVERLETHDKSSDTIKEIEKMVQDNI